MYRCGWRVMPALSRMNVPMRWWIEQLLERTVVPSKVATLWPIRGRPALGRLVLYGESGRTWRRSINRVSTEVGVEQGENGVKQRKKVRLICPKGSNPRSEAQRVNRWTQLKLEFGKNRTPE